MWLRSKVLFIGLFAAAFLLTACPSRTSISKINGDPSRYENKEVGVAGTVRDSYGVLGVGAYEVDDGTGSIWVVTQGTRAVPRKGSRVGVKGRVYNGFTLRGRNFGTVIEESDRRVK